ncbi:MAG: PorT family protein [Paludibacteraceae bacterium]|nr:PorT family protein [Paludibacteraceae bacterium]
MKKLLISALMLLAALSASAQLISAARDNDGVKFGVRGSFALSNMNQEVTHSANFGNIAGASVTSKQLPAFAVGFSMNLPVLESFHFNIELKYAMKGQKLVEKAELLSVNYENVTLERIGYLELPIQPQFRLNFSESSHLNVNVGPYLGLALHGNVKTKSHEEGKDDTITKFYTFTGKSFTRVEGKSRTWEDADNNYKARYSRLDVGLALGVDYQIENFHVGVSYDLGLKDINAFARDQKNDAGYSPIKNRTALFTLGFDF